MRIMKTLIAATAAAFAASCSPDVDEDVPPGALVYADEIKEMYRLGRRVEIVAIDPMVGRDGCGFLTDRAYEDLQTTIEALDPNKDYVTDPEECETVARVYIDGFEHSPFQCSWMCCHQALMPIAVVNLAILDSLYSGPPTINDEPYVALEPDRPCE